MRATLTGGPCLRSYHKVIHDDIFLAGRAANGEESLVLDERLQEIRNAVHDAAYETK